MPVYVVSPAGLGAALLKDNKEMREAIVDGMRVAVKLHGPRIAQALVRGENPAPIDRGTYVRDFKAGDIRDGVSFYNFAMHASIIEEGRRPGSKMPPLSAIEEWVRRKGLGSSFTGPVQALYGPSQKGKKKLSARVGAVARQQAGIALMIARKIAARGLKAHHILARTIVELEPYVDKAVDQALGRI